MLVNVCCVLLHSRAAELMTRTGQVVTLIVAKQGAIYHGLATLLSQPSPIMQRGELIHLFKHDVNNSFISGSRCCCFSSTKFCKNLDVYLQSMYVIDHFTIQTDFFIETH